MLVEEELLAPDLARKLLGWKHSGFSMHNGKPLRRDDADGLERVAQYIIRNPFSELLLAGYRAGLVRCPHGQKPGIG